MHASIFQLSDLPISKDEYRKPDDYSDDCNEFSDWFGDTRDEDERKSEIANLARLLSGFMELDGDALVFTSEQGLQEFRREWCDAIKSLSDDMTERNMFRQNHMWKLRKMTQKSHLYINDRFCIEGSSGDFPEAFDELIEYIGRLDVGDRLYIGSVVDFHF